MYSIQYGKKVITDKFYKIYPHQWIHETLRKMYPYRENNEVQSASLDIKCNNKDNILLYPNETVKLELLIPNNVFYEQTFYLFEKSTTARLGIKIKPIIEHNIVYIEITSKYFTIFLKSFTALIQAVFFDILDPVEPDKVILDLDLDYSFKLNKGLIPYNDKVRDDTFVLFEQTNPGYKTYNILSDKTYLYRSCSNINITTNVVGILNPLSNNGNFIVDNSVHYSDEYLGAGFIDPGFNTQLTYEISSQKTRYLPSINTEQFATVNIVPLTEITDKPYNGNYVTGSMLPKQCS